MELVEQVSAAYAWQRALGHEAVQDSLCRIVRDPEHPDVWDANHVSSVRASTTAEIDQLLQRVIRGPRPLPPPSLYHRSRSPHRRSWHGWH